MDGWLLAASRTLGQVGEVMVMALMFAHAAFSRHGAGYGQRELQRVAATELE